MKRLLCVLPWTTQQHNSLQPQLKQLFTSGRLCSGLFTGTAQVKRKWFRVTCAHLARRVEAEVKEQQQQHRLLLFHGGMHEMAWATRTSMCREEPEQASNLCVASIHLKYNCSQIERNVLLSRWILCEAKWFDMLDCAGAMIDWPVAKETARLVQLSTPAPQGLVVLSQQELDRPHWSRWAALSRAGWEHRSSAHAGTNKPCKWECLTISCLLFPRVKIPHLKSSGLINSMESWSIWQCQGRAYWMPGRSCKHPAHTCLDFRWHCTA